MNYLKLFLVGLFAMGIATTADVASANDAQEQVPDAIVQMASAYDNRIKSIKELVKDLQTSDQNTNAPAKKAKPLIVATDDYVTADATRTIKKESAIDTTITQDGEYEESFKAISEFSNDYAAFKQKPATSTFGLLVDKIAGVFNKIGKLFEQEKYINKRLALADQYMELSKDIAKHDFEAANQLLTRAADTLLHSIKEPSFFGNNKNIKNEQAAIAKIREVFVLKEQLYVNHYKKPINQDMSYALTTLQKYYIARYSDGREKYRGFGVSRTEKLSAAMQCYDEMLTTGNLKQDTRNLNAARNKTLGGVVANIYAIADHPSRPVPVNKKQNGSSRTNQLKEEQADRIKKAYAEGTKSSIIPGIGANQDEQSAAYQMLRSNIHLI